MTEKNREVVIPGEVVSEGEDFLPGDWTVKTDKGIVATRLGTLDKSDRLVKVIPISGVYIPRRGNTVIGEVRDLNSAGWSMNINAPTHSFLTLRECPMFVAESEMENAYGVGDLAVVKIISIKRVGIDVTAKGRGLGKIKEGIIVRVNPNRVPRIIGKEGSMIRLIKSSTGCDITVGQNGLVWVKGSNTEDEQFAKKAIGYIIENTIAEGLTAKVEAWLTKQGRPPAKADAPTSVPKGKTEDDSETVGEDK